MRTVIIGGGVIGLGTAYRLAKAGQEVTVVDAALVGSGASHGNAGWVIPPDVGPVAAPGMVLKALKWMLHSDSPLYVRPSLEPDFVRFMLAMARRCNASDFDAVFRANLTLCEGTMDLLDQMSADGVAFEMHTDGLFMAHADEHNFHKRVAGLATSREYGMDPEVLSGPQLAEREPGLKPTLAGAVYFPHVRFIRPDSFMAGLAQRCRGLGVQIIENAPVSAVRRAGDRVTAVVTPHGDVTGDQFLLAAGVHSGRLAGLFGRKLPIRPGKGYSIEFPNPPVQLTRAVNLSDAKVAVTPLAAGLRLAGTMEFAGLDSNINAARIAAIKRAPLDYFTSWDATDSHHSQPWAGARPMTADGMPIIGALPSVANAWVAAGHGMLGMTLGHVTSVAVADAMSGGTLPAGFDVFSPQRFAR